MTLDMIRSDFALLDDWEDRYRYVIELGRGLSPLPEAHRTDRYKVRGCASQVWLTTETERRADGAAVLRFQGDSDAHIVRGLIAILFAIYSGKTADDVLGTDGRAILLRASGGVPCVSAPLPNNRSRRRDKLGAADRADVS
jgi:cysteine desulfuration protein SufE